MFVVLECPVYIHTVTLQPCEEKYFLKNKMRPYPYCNSRIISMFRVDDDDDDAEIRIDGNNSLFIFT